MTVSNESSRQTLMDNEVEEDRERDGPTSSSTTWRTCASRWRTQGIVLNGEGEPVWLTPHQRDPQPEGERGNVSCLNQRRNSKLAKSNLKIVSGAQKEYGSY